MYETIMHEPVALSTSFLLHLLGVGTFMARLGKVARKVLFNGCCASSNASMVTVVLLDGASHFETRTQIVSTQSSRKDDIKGLRNTK